MNKRFPHIGRSCPRLAAAGLAVLTACAVDPIPPFVNPPIPDSVSAPDVADTANGSVKAVDANGIRSYFAIPFAAPPVGALRWAPPAAPANWTTPLANTQSAAPCLQTSASPFRLANAKEDCLYLDVHAPTGKGPFPVMVWIHGGAFNTGGATTYTNPAPLVSKNVIVVTIAYRLGALGFLGHPALRAADGSVGNYGIMDQQAALGWVKDNIAAFAGDKDNVTIFGESAGGFSVMTHLASPLSKDLFHKAIVQSGGYAFDRQLPKALLEANSTKIVNDALVAAGITCANVDAACLRGLSTEVVDTHLAAAFTAVDSSPVPSIDGKVLTKSIKQTFVAGENAKVPLMNGTNENEWALFIALGELGRRMAATPPNFDAANTTFALDEAGYAGQLGLFASGTGVPAETIATQYALANYGANAALQRSLSATAAGTDVVFACPALNLSKRMRTQESPIWMYEFRDQTALPAVAFDPTGKYFLSFAQGAAHSYELQYLFDLRDLESDERGVLQDAMTQYWTNFARIGRPNQGGTEPVLWPQFGEDSEVLGIDVKSGGGIEVLESSFETAHKCSTVWGALTY